MNIDRLQGLFEEQIRDLHSGESQMIDALPHMIEVAGDDRLRTALEDHLEETREQKRRLEEIAEKYDFEVTGHLCHGIKGILKEATELVDDETEDPDVRDAAIIASAQRLEHYEMAGYGTARTLAQNLGEEDTARRLQETLEEEKNAGETLTAIATSGANEDAVTAG